MKKRKHYLPVAMLAFAAFVLWTVLLSTVDVQAIGPNDSSVGMATLNRWFHSMTGVHWALYHITDWLGLVPIGFALGFALLGLFQWIKRKKLSKVDADLFVLGGFYIATIAVYILFENVVINYRPVLIDGCLEVSYPSSTTLLVMCVMPTAMMQLQSRLKSKTARCAVCLSIAAFILFMVVGRLICGVHWLSDILGGALLSTGLVTTYRTLTY